MITLLVANRGEIARRIFRTARQMQMRTVAVYSDADADAPFVREADEAIRIGPASPSESYLNIRAILDAAKQTEANLIHPGYGFLAESAEFAEACAAAGFTFVGPTPEVLRAMGAKDEAKRIAIAADVPILESYYEEDQSDGAFIAAAEKIGYPVMVKPVEGGGGKGMGVAHTQYQLEAALTSARRIAMAAFGDDRLLLERYIEGAHHVEVQILGDTYGNVVHLYERDCSLQRRHQKILEETPSPAINDETRRKLCEAAVRLARHVGYVSAGTCEFIVDNDGTASFLEVNARLQVEHPVTEMAITLEGRMEDATFGEPTAEGVVTYIVPNRGIDLVELQLRIAQGERIPFTQDEVVRNFHAIEVRIYAEDPEDGFLPQAGKITHLRWPYAETFARIDSGIEEETHIPPHYDPLIAKVISYEPTRPEALEQLRLALDKTQILGVRTNLPFLRQVLDRPEVARGRVTTAWLERELVAWQLQLAPTPEHVIALVAAAEGQRILAPGDRDPWSSLRGWKLGGAVPIGIDLVVDGEDLRIEIEDVHPAVVLGHTVERATMETSFPIRSNEDVCHGWLIDDRLTSAAYRDGIWYVWWDGRQYEITRGPRERRLEESEFAHLQAPMPGQVIAIKVEPGQSVVQGQDLVVVEAMKMEHTIRAPADGLIEAILCAVGQQVPRGHILVDFRPHGVDGESA